jgi:hypothetical protein
MSSKAEDRRLREGLISALNGNRINGGLAGRILDRWDERAEPWCERCSQPAIVGTDVGDLCRKHVEEEIRKRAEPRSSRPGSPA